jgi:hypothetical protein
MRGKFVVEFAHSQPPSAVRHFEVKEQIDQRTENNRADLH